MWPAAGAAVAVAVVVDVFAVAVRQSKCQGSLQVGTWKWGDRLWGRVAAYRRHFQGSFPSCYRRYHSHVVASTSPFLVCDP